VGPRSITVNIPTRAPETFPGVFTVEAGLGKGGLPSSVRDTFIPALTAVTPNSAIVGETNVKVDVTGKFTSFGSEATMANFGKGIGVTSLKINSPTSVTVTLDIAGSAAVGPRPVKIGMGPPVYGTFDGRVVYEPEGVMLANGFTVLPFPTEPQADRYESNDRREDAKLILSGMASCYSPSVRGGASTVYGVTFPPPSTITISANFHSASDTSDWFRVECQAGPPVQLPQQPTKYMDLRLAASISDGPPDGIYQIAINEGTTVLQTSTSGHAPAASYQWSPGQGIFSGIGKTLYIEVRHVGGAPSNQFYKLHIKLGE
jgi:hypothetical protein